MGAFPSVDIHHTAHVMADEQPLSQNDIDALLAAMGGTAPTEKPSDAAKPATDAAKKDASKKIVSPTGNATKKITDKLAAAPAASGPLDQDAIDALLAQSQGTTGSVKKPETVTKSTEKKNTAAPSGPLNQDDIDALLAQAQGSTTGSVKKTDAVTKSTDKKNTAAPSGPLDQDAIDALLAQTQGSTTGSVKKTDAVTKSTEKKNTAPAASGPLDQDAIDALFAQTSGPTDSKPGTGSKKVSDATPAPAAPAKGSAPAAEGPLEQDDIDKLLAALGGSSAPENAPAATVSPGNTSNPFDPDATLISPPPTSANEATLALSPDDLDALVERQAGTVSDHQEAPMIDQADIDALVKQLAQATGAPDTQKISDALAKHEGEIDKLLEQAGDPKVTLDAVPVSALNAASTGANRRTSPTTAIPVMATSEIKGARYLLAAAVLFLAMCATTLGMVVHAIQGLSLELKKQHEAQLIPSDNFADDFKAALAQLHAPDAADAAKGVLFLQRLKKNYPTHEGEIALALAKHFRSTGSLRQASEEFAGLAEINLGLFDDPRLYLDYADCLVDLNDVTAATKQVYRLLANENLYTGTIDRHGLTRPADEVARNKQALQDAYLTLGRLLSNAWKQNDTRSLAKATPHNKLNLGASHAPSSSAHAPAAAHAPVSQPHAAPDHGPASGGGH
jgi:hypothetical protein